MRVSQKVARAIHDAFQPTRVGLMIAGLEVPHVHLHLAPIDQLAELNFANCDRSPKPAEMDAAAERIRVALRARGHAEVADG
jgi:histidine triad (HIT) family protein